MAHPTHPARRGAFLMVAAATSLLAAGQAHAAAKYVYAGKKYDFAIKGCLTSLQHLTVTLLLPSTLPANANNLTVKPTSWVFNDGKDSFKGTQHVTFPATARFTTDSTGKITQWAVSATVFKGTNILYFMSTAYNGAALDSVTDNKCTGDGTAASDKPGTWKQP